jgi:hypothetical protein
VVAAEVDRLQMLGEGGIPSREWLSRRLSYVLKQRGFAKPSPKTWRNWLKELCPAGVPEKGGWEKPIEVETLQDPGNNPVTT